MARPRRAAVMTAILMTVKLSLNNLRATPHYACGQLRGAAVKLSLAVIWVAALHPSHLRKSLVTGL